VTALAARSETLMGTVVTITARAASDAAVDEAFEWFREVERACSRFDDASEVSTLSSAWGVATAVSPIVFECLRVLLAVADASGGAADPTVGERMRARGFDRRYDTGARATAGGADAGASFRDITLDESARTVRLERPLTLDLGAAAKGLAIDLAARALRDHGVRDFCIDAGGDLYCGGAERGDDGGWMVGIRHPRIDRQVIELQRVTDAAICTSGDYERRDDQGGHILDIRETAAPRPAAGAVSATVIAPTALLADVVSTAAFVLGPVDGVAFCARLRLAAIVYDTALNRHATPDLRASA
jgi:thiamine biosynthesis lipoprotein